jgi:hypothetical protein
MESKSNHDRSGSNSGTPVPSSPDVDHQTVTTSDRLIDDSCEENSKTEVFTSSDPNFWDYVRLKDFTKKTGIEAKDCHAFCIKELVDNAGDFIEKYRYSNAVIILEIINDKKNSIMTISVSNSNFGNIPVFDNLKQTFNYKRSYSSKYNQYRVTRGAQGDAIKEFGAMGYMLINSDDSEEEDKPWDYPIIFQHSRKIEKVYINVDRKHREIIPRFEQSGTCDNTDTKVTISRYHYGERVKRLGIDFNTIDYFISQANTEKKSDVEKGIRIKVRNSSGEFVEKAITTKEELQKYVEEPYPKAEDKDRNQQPGMNVITPLIRYARKYLLSVKYHNICDGDQRRFERYERYKYFYDNFEYLTGLNVDDVMEVISADEDKEDLANDEKAAINELLQNRDPTKAKRIELDSIIKIVRANLFSDFILDRLQHLFTIRKYPRAVTLPTEYFGVKFHILPENVKRLFQHCAEVADKAVKPMEEKIEEELDYWAPTEEEIERGIPRLLKIHDENALIEMRTSRSKTTPGLTLILSN